MPSSVTSRRTAVERSLLPAVIVPGRSEPMALDARMAHYQTPGVTIAVIASGAIEWVGGYGVCDSAGPQPVTASTLFQAASISKPLAALGALLLVQRGLLDLDEPVNKRLRSWQVPENDLTRREPVTLRRILSHTAGLTVQGVPGHARGVTLPSLPDFLDGRHPDSPQPVVVDVLPGTMFRYSGGGFTVMQLLIEDVTGRRFAAFMHDEVLAPLDMRDSTFEHPLPAPLEPAAASGHDAGGRPLDGKWTTFAASAAGGLWTTPTDLVRFAIAVQEAYAGRSSQLLGPDLAREMLRRQHPDGPCGLGFWLAGAGDSRRFFHGGSNTGYRCHLVAYAGRGDGAVVMTNGERGDALAAEVLNGVASVYNWPDYLVEKQVVELAPALLQEYAGTYVINDALPVTVALEDGRLVASAPGFGRAELLAMSDEAFFSTELPVTMTFRRDDAGAVIAADVEIAGSAVRAVKQ